MIQWKKGAGEFVSFTISITLLLFIFMIFVGFSMMENAINTIENSATKIQRMISVKPTKEEAEELAESEAIVILSQCKNIDPSTIRTQINYVGGCNSWEKGQFARLVISAKVKTNDPFTTRVYHSNVTFMIERNAGIEEESPSFIDTSITPGESTGLDAWFSTLHSVAESLELNNFRYSNYNLESTLSAATGQRNPKSNCALALSWAMQEYGAIPRGARCYYLHGLHTSGGWNTANLQIIDSNRKPASAGLQPGDICCFQLNASTGHMAVYVGKDRNGKRLWYSFGKEGTDTARTNGKFVSRKIGPVKHEYYNNHSIKKIIRIKNLS